jgi:hypothetical protein
VARPRGRSRRARSRRSAGVLVAMAFMISPVTSGKLKSSHLFASVTQASRIMFALLGVVCLLRQRCAPGGRFPCGLALGSHVVLSIFKYLIGYGRAVDCIAEHILSTTRSLRRWRRTFGRLYH